MFTDQLKEATLSNHQQTEKQLILRMKAMRSIDAYVSLLQMFYSYFGGLEQKINAFVGEQNLPDYNQRRKTDAIATDIQALDGAVPAIANSNELPTINSLPKAF